MIINKVRIKNFRSFSDAEEIEFSKDYTAITGRNNSGKSNVLRALDLFFNGVIDGETQRYNYDANLNVQNEGGGSFITITVTVKLHKKSDRSLITKFDKLKSSNIIDKYETDNVRFSLSVRKGDTIQIAYLGNRRYQGEHIDDLFYNYFRKSVNFIYIPAIKDYKNFFTKDITKEIAKRIFNTFGGNRNPEAKKLKEEFDALLAGFRDIIKKTNENLTDIYRDHSPDAGTFKFTLPFNSPGDFLESLPVYISDNCETDLARKGSGVQSLSLFSVLRYLDKYKPTNKYALSRYIWAIEEPETFLHPSAQTELFNAFVEYTNEIQIITTTHSYNFLGAPGNYTSCIIDMNNGRSTSSTCDGGAEAYEGILGSYRPTYVEDERLFSGKTPIFVEGKLDISYLELAMEYDENLKYKFEDKFVLIDGNGDEVVSRFISSAEIYKLAPCAVVDGDTKGKKYYNQLERYLGSSDGRLLKLPDGKAMENLIPDSIRLDFISSLPKEIRDFYQRDRIGDVIGSAENQKPPQGGDKDTLKKKLLDYCKDTANPDDLNHVSTIILEILNKFK